MYACISFSPALAMSAGYGTGYRCPMSRLSHWYMYLVVSAPVLVVIIIIMPVLVHTYKWDY